MPVWGTILVALITSGTLTTGVIWFYERRERRRMVAAEAEKTEADANKTNAEANNLLADTWKGALEELRCAFDLRITNMEISHKREIDIITKQMGALEQVQNALRMNLQRAYARIEHLMWVIKQLNAQIRKHDEEPCAEPCEWNPDEEEIN